jgi:RnfABCDGE-type electron transport complex D subunit
MEKFFNLSSNPHMRDGATTSLIMAEVIIALLPASAFGIYNFGISALFVIITAILSAVLSEYFFLKITKQKNTVVDLSAVLTGLLLALNLPHDFPLWMTAIGSAFAIIVVKQVFGGIGQNFMNPALAARCFLILSFGSRMTVFTYDGVTGATPLKVLKDTGKIPDLFDMFIGTIGGTIGETSAIALIIGGLYLIARRIIDYRIPLYYIGSFMLFIMIFGNDGFNYKFLLAHLFGGGILLGAFFMATDYVTSPITKRGRIVYGIILGVLTGIFRIYGPNAEGVSFAIIFSNLLVPFIEKFTMPHYFGYRKKAVK